jgi:hypothetical protein
VHATSSFRFTGSPRTRRSPRLSTWRKHRVPQRSTFWRHRSSTLIVSLLWTGSQLCACRCINGQNWQRKVVLPVMDRAPRDSPRPDRRPAPLRQPVSASVLKKACIVDLLDKKVCHVSARDEAGAPVPRIDQHAIRTRRAASLRRRSCAQGALRVGKLLQLTPPSELFAWIFERYVTCSCGSWPASLRPWPHQLDRKPQATTRRA